MKTRRNISYSWSTLPAATYIIITSALARPTTVTPCLNYFLLFCLVPLPTLLAHTINPACRSYLHSFSFQAAAFVVPFSHLITCQQYVRQNCTEVVFSVKRNVTLKGCPFFWPRLVGGGHDASRAAVVDGDFLTFLISHAHHAFSKKKIL